MSIQLYDYQQKAIDEIIQKFETNERVLFQLSTGGGKTFCFSFLTKWWVENKKQKVIINCHRKELVDQTIMSLAKIGVPAQAITASTKRVDQSAMVYVAMIQTAYNRLKKNENYFGNNIGLMINDECHILIFDKTFKFFPNTKILGVTATPVILERIKFFKCRFCKKTYDTQEVCCSDQTSEWSKPYAMAELYNDIVVGPSIKELIDRSFLVDEMPLSTDYVDYSKLKTDGSGEYTNKSMDDLYSDEDAVFNVVKNYEEYCKDKKTIIFNSSSKTNLKVYQSFLDAGYNARMFDSVNKKESGDRKDLVKWFNETPDAILCNVNVFTTGFDSREVEAIILNRPTQSLSLYLQIIGRGARVSKEIYKPFFTVIDGGGNINRFGLWSDESRDWKKIFFEGIGEEKAKKEDILDVQECENCGFLQPKSNDICENCGEEFKIFAPKERKEVVLSDRVAKPIKEIPYPNGEKIYQYTLINGEDINFSFKVMISQIVDMFRFFGISKELFESTVKNGNFKKKVMSMIRNVYFVLIEKKDIQASNNRTLQYLYNRTYNAIKKYYDGK